VETVQYIVNVMSALDGGDWPAAVSVGEEHVVATRWATQLVQTAVGWRNVSWAGSSVGIATELPAGQSGN
jgi:hypothetical protein